MSVDRSGRGVIGATAAAALAVATPVAIPDPAAAETPTRLWQGVARVGIACLVNTDRGVDTGALKARLCGRVRALAAAGSPVPVAAVEIGDAGMFRPDHLTLLVHASTRGTPGGRLMAVAIRPWRGEAGADLLFGAEPRVVASDADDARLDAALAVPLAQLLPWLTPGPRPIH